MYTVKLNDNLIYDSSSNLEALQLSQASISLVAGEAGTFSFSVPPTNTAYDYFHKLIDYVDVYQDGTLIFSGRVYSENKDFRTIQNIVCEGLRAVLNDTIFRPIEFNGTLSQLVEQLVANHNSQVSADRQITIGTIEPTDNYLYRSYETYDRTMSRFTDLLDSYGGYISVTKTSNGLQLDWFEGFGDKNEQTIDFGENLLDITQESNAATIISVLIPLGAEVEGSDGVKKRVDIKSVNENSDFITNQTALNEFGRIVGTATWDDVTEPARLLTKATEYLNDVARSKVTITASAVDLANAGYDIDHFAVAEKVKVTSKAHGINGTWFDVQNMVIDICNPSANSMTLGYSAAGYVGKTSRNIENLGAKVEIINNNYADNTQVQQTFTQYATAIQQNSQAISTKAEQSTVDSLSGRVTNVETVVVQNSEELALYFGTNGKISSWFTFTDNKFSIGKADSSIHSEQDNQSYRFVDASNNILLEINPDGTISQTVNVNKQVAYWAGNERQWAIRKGKYITGKGVNLNDVWLGD